MLGDRNRGLATITHITRLRRSMVSTAADPGPVAQAITFRAFGAEDLCSYQRPTKTNGDQKNGWGFVSMT